MSAQTENMDVVPLIKSGEEDKLAMPHSREVEEALLGLLMLDNNFFENVEDLLRPEHFYTKFYGEVFRQIGILLEKGFEASPITLRETMKQQHDAEGDLKDYLVGIMENASLANDVTKLAETIRNYFTQRQLMEIGAYTANRAREIAVGDQEQDIENLISQTEGELFKLGEQGEGSTTFVDMRSPLKNVIMAAEEAKRNNGQLVGITSGLKDIDNKLGGFQRSDLIILAARPSMGKTAFSLNIAQNAAAALMNGKPGGASVAVFSMEMSAEQLVARILSGSAAVDSHRLQSGQLDDEEFGRIVSVSNTLSDLKIFIDDQPQIPISTLRSRCRRLKRQHNIDLIVVDYLQLMRGSGMRKNESRVQEISEISMGLKTVARELNVPVIALSQLSRGVESRDNKRPMLSDLRESGSIEQDADVVMFLYREDYYLEKALGATPTPEQLEELEKIRGITELLISKNRKGPTTTVRLTFDAPRTKFKDYVDSGKYEGYGGDDE